MKKAGYRQLNVEIYGGAILNTWLDRPLSASGRVALRSDDVFHPQMRLVDFKKPFLTIPNLAIHMNREVNKGVELNRQKDKKGRPYHFALTTWDEEGIALPPDVA